MHEIPLMWCSENKNSTSDTLTQINYHQEENEQHETCQRDHEESMQKNNDQEPMQQKVEGNEGKEYKLLILFPWQVRLQFHPKKTTDKKTRKATN